jgi:hypothetical protein
MMTLILTLCLSAQVQDDLTARANVVRPKAGEYKWQQIPWILDLGEGIKAAREEKRPVLLWVSGDDPLERC